MWACNLDAVDVFQLCPVVAVGAGMGGLHWQGIAPSEIRSVCFLLRLPRVKWPELVGDVVFMGRCVADARNRQAAEQAWRSR